MGHKQTLWIGGGMFWQGYTLVVIPVLSEVWTNGGAGEGLGVLAYGSVFIWQTAATLFASGLAPGLMRRGGPYVGMMVGMTASLVGMACVAAVTCPRIPVSLGVLLSAGAAGVGLGFGFFLPSASVAIQKMFCRKGPSAMTGFYTALGLGTVLMPWLYGLHSGQGAWMRLVIGIIAAWCVWLSGGLALTLARPFRPAGAAEEPSRRSAGGVPPLLWALWSAMLGYAVCETLFTNWGVLFVTQVKEGAASTAGHALAAYWMMVTLGRLVLAFRLRENEPLLVYPFFPLAMAGAFLFLGKAASAFSLMIGFGLAGLACSAFFPLSFSLAQMAAPDQAEKAAGGMMAAYMLGYGLSCWGTGFMVENGAIPLSGIYRAGILASAGISAGLFLLKLKREGRAF